MICHNIGYLQERRKYATPPKMYQSGSLSSATTIRIAHLIEKAVFISTINWSLMLVNDRDDPPLKPLVQKLRLPPKVPLGRLYTFYAVFFKAFALNDKLWERVSEE
jgi:hypothetical protein